MNRMIKTDFLGWPKQSLPIFGVKVDEIIINSTIFELEDSDEIAMASGCTGILMCMKMIDFKNMTTILKTNTVKLPIKSEDGVVSPLIEKVEKLSVQPN